MVRIHLIIEVILVDRPCAMEISIHLREGERVSGREGEMMEREGVCVCERVKAGGRAS